MQRDKHFCEMMAICRAAGYSPEDSKIIAFSNYQTDNVKSWSFHTQVNALTFWWSKAGIYFHFVPDRTSSLTTIPDGGLVLLLLNDALLSGNLFRIGIACHSFQDSFSHDGFVGAWSTGEIQPAI